MCVFPRGLKSWSLVEEEKTLGDVKHTSAHSLTHILNLKKKKESLQLNIPIETYYICLHMQCQVLDS